MNIFTDPLNFNKIIFRDKFYYPKEINASIDKLSSYLNTNKSSNSPFVYLFAHNHIKTVIAYFAIIRSNKICVLVDPEIKHIELNEMMQDTPPYAIIKFNNMSERFDYEKDIFFTKNNIEIKDKLDDVCTMVYTAAENGYAKAAMLTRENILSNAYAILDCDIVNEKSVCCALAPFNHMYGLQTGVFAPLSIKGSLLIEDITNVRQFKMMVINISKYCVTNIYSIPMIYHLMMKISDIKETLKSVNTLVSGGYKLSNKIFQSFNENTEKELHNGYGLTEASPICTWHRPEDIIKNDSVGRAFSCCKVKIVDNKNVELPIDHIGEICIKGSNIMKGYYNNEKTTKEVLKDGWLYTGDFGKTDNDHYIYLTGLKKNMLNVCGKNVYPAEVERLIKSHNNVISINTYGDPDELQGHFVKAKIKLKKNNNTSQDELQKWCLENITNYKVPRKIIYH